MSSSGVLFSISLAKNTNKKKKTKKHNGSDEKIMVWTVGLHEIDLLIVEHGFLWHSY